MILTAEEFARLRRSDDPAEYNRAAHEEAPIEVWLAVIDRYPDLREWVAYNKSVALSILERLATDPDEKVRSTVVGKRKLSAELQALLARDPDAGVRQRLAYNAKCATDILQLLASDPDKLVREGAGEKLAKRRAGL
jgi:hypothetical protein